MPDIKGAKASLLNITDGRVNMAEVNRDDFMDSMIRNYFNPAAGNTTEDAALKRLAIVTTGGSDYSDRAVVKSALEKFRN
jgi:hypothetical protein